MAAVVYANQTGLKGQARASSLVLFLLATATADITVDQHQQHCIQRAHFQQLQLLPNSSLI
jgi:hypothetical protein